MTTWFTADPHLFHLNICRLADRPFSGMHEMNEALVAKWVGCITPTDTVYVLGDFVLGHREETLSVLSRLPGDKHLMVGNHDGPFDDRPKQRTQWTAKYLQAGFTSVTHGSVGYLLAGRYPVLLSHFPYQPDERHEDRHVEHHPHDGGLPLLHGHVHSAWTLRGRQYNVGVDVQDFLPRSEEFIVAELQAAGVLG